MFSKVSITQIQFLSKNISINLLKETIKVLRYFDRLSKHEQICNSLNNENRFSLKDQNHFSNTWTVFSGLWHKHFHPHLPKLQ